MELGIDLLIRWGHILPAVLLAGGTWYMVLALHPVVSGLEDAQRTALKDQIRARWSKAVMACSGLLLVSGLAMFVRMAITFDFPERYYHPVGGLKFLLALVVFFIASLLTGRSKNRREIPGKRRQMAEAQCRSGFNDCRDGGAFEGCGSYPQGGRS
jgi:uncharacterized membrane protein